MAYLLRRVGKLLPLFGRVPMFRYRCTRGQAITATPRSFLAVGYPFCPSRSKK
jgi:hypothetical protein